MRTIDVDAVTAVVRDVGRSIVGPGQSTLSPGDIEEKSPGEVVTSVDRTAEAALSAALTRLLPGSRVIGEEACASQPELLDQLGEPPPMWLVDPLDGTRNYIDGSPDYAVMVALVSGGETVAGWIDRPAVRVTYVAERGAGAFADARRLVRVPAAADLGALRGAALTRFLDDERRAAVARLALGVDTLGPGRMCAGVDYPLVAGGEQDFVLFWRTLPWDHAAGALLVTESGGFVARLDGSPYVAADTRPGLLVAADAKTHRRVAAVLLA
jgi:fructose-1,6-bisphosphatase/inositol monophosphatase family enzyme